MGSFKRNERTGGYLFANECAVFLVVQLFHGVYTRVSTNAVNLVSAGHLKTERLGHLFIIGPEEAIISCMCVCCFPDPPVGCCLKHCF